MTCVFTYKGKEYVDEEFTTLLKTLPPEELAPFLGVGAPRSSTPDMPFKDNKWAALALKRIIRWAATEGFDAVAWIPGNIQNGRVVENTGDNRGAFYDKILVNIANDIGKKYGARVGTADVVAGADSPERPVRVLQDGAYGSNGWTIEVQFNDGKLGRHFEVFDSKESAESALAELRAEYEKRRALFHALPLTPELRDAAMGGFTYFSTKTPGPGIEPQPEGLPKMKLSRAEIERVYGPEAVKKLEALLGTGEIEFARTVAREIEQAAKAAKGGKRLWVWIREKGGLADEDVRDMIDGARKFPGLYQTKGRGIDDLLVSAVDEGFVPMRKDADGYIIPLEPDEFRDMIRRDIGGEPQYSAAHDGTESEAAALLSRYREMGVDVEAKGAALEKSILEAVKGERFDTAADDAAPWFGFSSGDEMIRAMLAAKPRAEAIRDAAHAAMIEENGDPFEDGTFEREAMQAAHSQQRERVLETELAAIRRAVGGRQRPVTNAAKAAAKRQAQAMTVSQLSKPDQFAAAGRRFALQAMKAMERGDFAEAERAKYRELVSFHLWREAAKAQRRIETTLKKWKRLAESETTRKAIAPRDREQIDALLQDMGLLPPGPRPAMALEDWVQSLQDQDLGDLVVFQPATIRERARRQTGALLYSEFTEMADAIENIAHMGRTMMKFRAMQKAQSYADAKAELLKRIDEEWPDKLSRKVTRLAPSRLDKAIDNLRHFHGVQIKIDYLARLLDGLKDNGPWARMLTYAAQAAQNDQTARELAAMAEFRAILEAHGVDRRRLNENLTRRIFIPEIGDNLTRHQILSVALNMGNEYNRNAVMQGEGWTPEQLQAVLAPLEKQDWDLVQALWNYVGQWKEESFALDERTRGVRPPEVQAQAFMTPHGMYPGGYWPVAFDPQLSDAAAQREAREAANAEFGAGYRQPATSRGRLKARTGTGGQKLLFDWTSVLDKHVRDTLKDLTHRELVIDLRRIKADPEIRNAVAAVAGKDAVRSLDAWVHRLAEKKPLTPFGDIGGLAAYLRRSATNAAMGWKISVSVLNLLGALQAVPRNGIADQLKQTAIGMGRDFPQLVASEIGRALGGPGRLPKRIGFVRAKSKMMENRLAGFDRDLQQEGNAREVMADVRGRRDQSLMPKAIEDSMHYLTALVDSAVSVPTWLAAYERALAGKVKGIEAGDEAAAIAAADQVVLTTQGAGQPKDLAAMMASNNEFQRLMTMFMTWANGFYNQLTMEQFPGVASGKISLPRFTVNMIAIWLLPAFIGAWFFGRLEPQDGEDDDDRNRRFLLELLIYPGQSIPFVRDALSALVSGYEPRTPLNTPIQNATKLSSAIERGDDRQIVKQGYALFGDVTGAPRQLYITGDYLYDAYEGDEDLGDWTDPETVGDATSEALLRDTR